jgi:hypothetical protein
VGLCRLLANDTLRKRLAEAGFAKAQNYSWKKISRQVLEVYDETIEAQKRLPRKGGLYTSVEWLPPTPLPAASVGPGSNRGRAAQQNAS